MKDLLESLPRSPIGHIQEDYLPFLESLIKLINPKSIIEIGFNAGHSSAVWLSLTDALVTSIDISTADHTKQGIKILKDKFANRFTFINSSSQNIKVYMHCKNIKNRDLIFIDGDHSFAGCLNDLTLSKMLGMKNIIIDNLEDANVMMAVAQFLSTEKEYELKSIDNIPFSVDNNFIKLALVQKIC